MKNSTFRFNDILSFALNNVNLYNPLFFHRFGEVTVFPHWIVCDCGEKRLSYESLMVAQVDVSTSADNERVSLAELYKEYLRYTF